METQWTQPLTLTSTYTDTEDTVTQAVAPTNGDTVDTATNIDLTDTDTEDAVTHTGCDRWRHCGHSHSH
jgi:hypothetical protein